MIHGIRERTSHLSLRVALSDATGIDRLRNVLQGRVGLLTFRNNRCERRAESIEPEDPDPVFGSTASGLRMEAYAGTGVVFL
jgi:hypothetical protein